MFEDDDFSVRVLEHGRRIVSAEDCFIHHFGNGSFAKLPSAKAQQIFEDNRAEFERKWKRRWLPHKTRPGVLPPGPQDRMKLDGFVRRASP
jgi:GT2 family glycosyltransferase